jgi:single-strand DNA-binding protein
VNNLNSILLEGRLALDPVFLSFTGKSTCDFKLASYGLIKDKGHPEQQEVLIILVRTFGKLAEHCRDLGSKGRGCRVIGKIKQERWSAVDGESHERFVIVADHVEFGPLVGGEEDFDPFEDVTFMADGGQDEE